MASLIGWQLQEGRALPHPTAIPGTGVTEWSSPSGVTIEDIASEPTFHRKKGCIRNTPGLPGKSLFPPNTGLILG